MKILLTILLSLLLIGGFSQQIPNGNPITNAPNSWVSYGYTRDSGKIFIVRDTFNARYPTVVMRPDGILWKTLGNGAYWYMVGSSAIDTSKLVTHTALNDSLLSYVKIQTQNPTSSLVDNATGLSTVNMEFHSAGSFSSTLNWSAGRLGAGVNLAETSPIYSIAVAGSTIIGRSCSPTPCITSSSKSVTVNYNTNTSFNNAVTTTDNKTATSTVNYNFYANNYWGASLIVNPDTTTVLAMGGGNKVFATNRVYAPTVNVPSGGTYYYVYYAYPSSYGALTSIKDQAGNQIIDAFTQTTLTFNNASGYRQSYYVYTSNNSYLSTANPIYVSYQ